MGYHLSKDNEKWLFTFIDILREAKETTLLETKDPRRLLYVLSQSRALPTYSWLKEKFIFSLQPDGVLCKIKTPEVKIPKLERERPVPLELDLLGVVNKLVQEKPGLLTISLSELSSDDIIRLQTYCEVNGYSIEQTQEALTIKKDA